MAKEMTEREKEIRTKRAQAYDGMVAIMEKLDSGERLTVEDRTDFDAREKELTELDADLERVTKMVGRESGRDEVAETRGISRDEMDNGENAYTRAFGDWFRSIPESHLGVAEMNGVDRNGPAFNYMRSKAAGTENRDAILTRAELDTSSLQTIPGQGGFMIPQGFWENLQIALKQYGGVLPLCNVVKTASGNEMPWPTTNPTNVVGSYITEANQVGFNDFTFGQGVLYAWTITSGVILASFQLINDSAFDVDSFVTDRMGEAIGRKVAQELWSGAGSASKALTGITTAITANGGSGSGALSSPGYAKGAAGEGIFTLASPSSTVHADTSGIASWGDLTAMIADVDVAYRSSGRCVFVMNDSQVQLQRTLTDGFGHPLWEPNTQAGQPDVILGYPVVVDNNAPSVSTSTSTAGGILFGDLKTAMVVRQVDMAGTMRLTERYADYLQVGYLGYVRMDSQPNDLRAVVEFQTAAS